MTTTEIVNLALSKLGSSLISSLGDETVPGSKHGDLLYMPMLNRILREFPWSFATREATLAQLPAATSTDWDYSYTLPSDSVRLLKVKGTEKDSKEENFARHGNTLHAKITPVVVEYITNNIEPDDFDGDFQDAFVTLLASELAAPVKQSVQLGQAMREEYLTITLPKAKATDSREVGANENAGPYKAISKSPIIQSRFWRRS